MQKYVVVEIITQSDGRIAAPVNAFEDEAQAYKKYYTILGIAATSAYPTHGAVLLTYDGQKLESKCFKREVVEEPES